MEKLTREQFKAKYGFDPSEEKAKISQAPKRGAVSGSTNPPAKLTADEVAKIRSGGMTAPTKLSTEQVAGIRGVQPEGFQPNKFVQAMEDVRPNYIKKGEGSGKDGRRTFGDIGKNISEGITDIGVGVVKGAVRTLPEIIQTLTPDAMWGENSLLNSESDRAQAFRSATTGKTGLQKAGATGFDLASMFVPVGAGNLVSKGATGASKLARMATSGMDLATEAPSILQRGGKLLNTIAPSVGDAVVSGAIAGRGDSPVGDILLGTLSPIASKGLSVMSKAFGSQQAKSALAGVKDYFVGGNKYKNQIFDAAMKEINDKGIDVLKEKIPQVADNRVIIRELLKPQLGKMFGKGTKGIDKLNEASDIFTLGYFDKVDVIDGITDYTKVQDALSVDKDIVGGIIGNASQVIKNEAVPVKTVMQSLGDKMKSTGVNTTSNGYRDAEKLVQDFVNSRTNNGARGLTVYELQGLKDSLISQVKNPANGDDIKMLYSSMYSWANDMIYKVAKKSGRDDVAELIKEANSVYSKLKNVEDVVTAMSKTRTNPFGLTQGQKIALSYGAGAAGGMAAGPLGVPAAMIVAGPASKMIGSFLTKRSISNLKSNVYKKAASVQRTKQQEVLTNKLSDILKKQAKNKANK